MTEKEESEKKKERSPREFLPFWIRETLKMVDDAERSQKAEKSSVQEDSSLLRLPSACP